MNFTMFSIYIQAITSPTKPWRTASYL